MSAPRLLPTADPFRILTPDLQRGLLSFSGGRTSGLLLRRTLDAYGGGMPPEFLTVFCNTGREMPETLDFVHECERRWNVPILWLEYRPREWTDNMEGCSFGPEFVDTRGYMVVTYETASRKGEPFEALLAEHVNRRDGTRGVRPLPNPVSRVCTTNLKTRLKKRYVTRALGWTGKYPERAQWWADVEARQLESDRPSRFRQDRPSYGDMLQAVKDGKPIDFGVFDDLTTCGSHGCTD